MYTPPSTDTDDAAAVRSDLAFFRAVLTEPAADVDPVRAYPPLARVLGQVAALHRELGGLDDAGFAYTTAALVGIRSRLRTVLGAAISTELDRCIPDDVPHTVLELRIMSIALHGWLRQYTETLATRLQTEDVLHEALRASLADVRSPEPAPSSAGVGMYL